RERIDGLDVVIQDPLNLHAEVAYLHATATTSYAQMTAVRHRLLEVLHHQLHRRLYRKRTALAMDMVAQLEAEGQFPQADYAFDNGVLTVDLTRLIESKGKHWVSEVESSRHILWKDEWRRIDEVAAELRQTHPESFRQVHVRCRNGEQKLFWAFTKSVRLKRYGRKRIAMVYEREELTD